MNSGDLKAKFSGTVIVPEDPGYRQVQSTLFFKGAPAVVLQPKTNDDVALAIKYSRENSLKLSIRSGGHNGAGFSTNKGGVVVDLSLMKDVQVIDQTKHIVRIQGGAIWGDIAKELHKSGWGLSSGDTISVGVGGLTLGAGVGWMVRKYGLAIDSLVAAEVVTADGKVVRASDSENPDLFWALRGGGGNFGVVTAFEFAAHPIGKVFSGKIVYGLDALPQLMTGWRDAMRTAPEDLTTMLVTLPSFMGMPPSAIVMCCYASDDKSAADKALKPLRNLGKLVSDDVSRMEYFEVLEEAHPPEGTEVIVKNGFVSDFSDELAHTVAGLYTGETGPILQIRGTGGAMNRVAADATAFAHRASEALIVAPTFMPPGATAADKEKVLQPWRQIAPFTKGAYINFFTDPDEPIDTMYPPATQKKLAKVKKQYDPTNVFDQNFNIKP
ncbi:MAG TPA: FAD-binding oxidoreductase [Verrucomicrobiae bacterium]|nr:FAD-binding oxidoreductase [Verrucomicrobiae bacterium]